MIIVPEVSWVPTVSCDVPPLEVVAVVDVELVAVVVVVVLIGPGFGAGSTSYAFPPYKLAELEVSREPFES